MSAATFELPTQDGEIVTLPDGRELRLRIEPDDMWRGLDDDGLGQVEWGRANLYGRIVRPDSFNGHAEILDRSRDSVIWWQPPADLVRGTDQYARIRQIVRDVCEYGYQIVTLELRRRCECCTSVVVDDVAGIGGIVPFPDDNEIRDVIESYLLPELGLS